MINFKVMHKYGIDKNQMNITFPSIFVQGIMHILYIILFTM